MGSTSALFMTQRDTLSFIIRIIKRPHCSRINIQHSFMYTWNCCPVSNTPQFYAKVHCYTELPHNYRNRTCINVDFRWQSFQRTFLLFKNSYSNNVMIDFVSNNEKQRQCNAFSLSHFNVITICILFQFQQT